MGGHSCFSCFFSSLHFPWIILGLLYCTLFDLLSQGLIMYLPLLELTSQTISCIVKSVILSEFKCFIPFIVFVSSDLIWSSTWTHTLAGVISLDWRPNCLSLLSKWYSVNLKKNLGHGCTSHTLHRCPAPVVSGIMKGICRVGLPRWLFIYTCTSSVKMSSFDKGWGFK